MSKRLVKLLDSALPAVRLEEDYFLAGPVRAVRRADGRGEALLADLRRQRSTRRTLAA